MKLVSYGSSGAEQPGVLVEDDAAIVPLAPLWRELGQPPPDMNAAVGLLPWLREAIDDAVARCRSRIDCAGVRLGPPVPRPSKIVVCGLNTRSQLREAQAFFGTAAPRRPPLALRPPTNVSGPRDTVACPPQAGELDYEAELAVVIGRAARRVARAHADRHIAGYMCAQDLTSRALLRGDTDLNPLFLQPTHGKGVDSFCPTGPWLVTTDEIADPGALSIRAWVNGELRQDGSTAELIVGIPELVEWLSATFMLLPGDIILTGTPAGMGGALDPPQLLRHGDIVRTAITGLGEMVNRVEEIAAAPSA
jgi:2-keto-4-pentenoate hydratase/2-oxohepta-3-ene-1,7-dioic acid hydratase in catechol pathway